MKNKEYYFNKLISTGGEISSLASVLKPDFKLDKDSLSEWKIRKSLLIEKLKIVLDEAEDFANESVENNK